MDWHKLHTLRDDIIKHDQVVDIFAQLNRRFYGFTQIFLLHNLQSFMY
jgi:hypothetical protein